MNEKNNREEIIKDILEEESKIRQQIENIEKQIIEIKTRINVKQEYLNKLYETYGNDV